MGQILTPPLKGEVFVNGVPAEGAMVFQLNRVSVFYPVDCYFLYMPRKEAGLSGIIIDKKRMTAVVPAGGSDDNIQLAGERFLFISDSAEKGISVDFSSKMQREFSSRLELFSGGCSFYFPSLRSLDGEYFVEVIFSESLFQRVAEGGCQRSD